MKSPVNSNVGVVFTQVFHQREEVGAGAQSGKVTAPQGFRLCEAVIPPQGNLTEYPTIYRKEARVNSRYVFKMLLQKHERNLLCLHVFRFCF